MIRVWSTILSIFALHAGFAQEEALRAEVARKTLNRTNNETFMEQTLNYSSLSYVCLPYTDIGSPKKHYILSADVIPQFVIGGKWSPFPIHLTPRYKVRIFRNNDAFGDSSLPVRTPSFMPGATVYFRLKSFKKPTDKIRYGSVSFFHHSNGQDGPELDRLTGKYNTYNGNFSTNFFELAYHFRNRKTYAVRNARFQCYDNSPGYKDTYGRIAYEHHVNVADSMVHIYGINRINLLIGHIWVNNFRDVINGVPADECYTRERQRIVFSATIIAGPKSKGLGAIKNRINADVNYYWRIPSSPNTALFAGAGYYGSDTYNVYFEQSYFYARLGISLGFFVAPGWTGRR